ncbi:hypothetical protein B0T12DRAFT_215530 [Alternaria alternata]|nr:hypothetical protein B0T12DRAFT_215530 [Alternaria alternata]
MHVTTVGMSHVARKSLCRHLIPGPHTAPHANSTNPMYPTTFPTWTFGRSAILHIHRRQSIRPDISTPMPMSRCSTPRATPLAGYANASKRCTRKTLHGKDSVWTILRRSLVPTRGYEAVGRR